MTTSVDFFFFISLVSGIVAKRRANPSTSLRLREFRRTTARDASTSAARTRNPMIRSRRIAIEEERGMRFFSVVFFVIDVMGVHIYSAIRTGRPLR